MCSRCGYMTGRGGATGLRSSWSQLGCGDLEFRKEGGHGPGYQAAGAEWEVAMAWGTGLLALIGKMARISRCPMPDAVD